MRNLVFAMEGSLLLAAAVTGQNPGMSTQATRALTAVSEMGRSTVASDALSNLTTFEESDDPTISAHAVARHEPLPAARKAADKADRLAKKKRGAEAIAKYREALALDPLYFEAWNNLALVLNASGQTEEAEQVYRRLMQSNPEHVLVFTNLASLLSGQHRDAEAEVVTRQALKLHKYSFRANFILGAVLVNQGKWSEEAKIKLQYAQVKYPEAGALLDRWPTRSAAP